MSHDQVLARVKYAADQGATQIMIQGGVNPELPLDVVRRAFRARARRVSRTSTSTRSRSPRSPASPTSRTCRRATVLERLKAAGLKSLPGAGAEILVERVRKRISARKVTPHEWLDVMREAQQLGMPTTATMMFGSIETDEERIEHMHVLRELQDETGGFTAFIPWYYVPFKTPLRGKEATALEYLRVLAVSRLYLDNFAAPAGVVADAGPEDGPARAVLRLRRHGRNDHRRPRRARRRRDQRSDAPRSRKRHHHRRLQARHPRHVLERAAGHGARV